MRFKLGDLVKMRCYKYSNASETNPMIGTKYECNGTIIKILDPAVVNGTTEVNVYEVEWENGKTSRAIEQILEEAEKPSFLSIW